MQNKTEINSELLRTVYTNDCMTLLRVLVEVYGKDEEFILLSRHLRDSLTKFFEDFVGVDPIDRDKRISAMLFATSIVLGGLVGPNLEKISEGLRKRRNHN